MSEPEPAIPEYGIGGDLVGARRARRAFRFCVIGAVVLTLVLYLCERYLRHDLAETQYIMALTLEDPSARAILRNVVHRDAAAKDAPSAKYVEALAAIEEEDNVLERYQQAYKLNQNSASLVINYGCRLFHDGKYKEARERFREAGILPPKNALPRYLEAAALAFSTPGEEGATEALALVARTNSSGDPVLVPAPLWHVRLPRQGQWYSELRRRVADECLAPLYQFEARILGIIENNLVLGDYREWDSWLNALEQLGRRLSAREQLLNASSGEDSLQSVGISQVVAGIQFQVDALTVAQRIAESAGAAIPADQQERMKSLDAALDRLRSFEAERDAAISRHAEIVKRPLWLALKTIGILFAVLAAAMFVHWFVTGNRRSWALRFISALLVGGILLLFILPPAGELILVILALVVFFRALTTSESNAWSLTDAPVIAVVELIALLLFLALFAWLTYLQSLGPHAVTALDIIDAAWWILLALTVVIGALFPLVALPRPAILLAKRAVDAGEVSPNLLKVMKRGYGIAYATAIRRYAGALFGGTIMLICLWVIAFRIYSGLYPIQIKILTTGVEDLELQTLREVREILK